jgi:hypothetical protein
MKSIYTPMEASGAVLLVGDSSTPIVLHGIPDGADLAAFIAYACNNHYALVKDNNDLRDQLEAMLSKAALLSASLKQADQVNGQLVAALKAARPKLVEGQKYSDECPHMATEELHREFSTTVDAIDAALTAAGAA